MADQSDGDDLSEDEEQLVEDYLRSLNVADATIKSREFAVRGFLGWLEQGASADTQIDSTEDSQ